MKQYITIQCPYCSHGDLTKNGHSENGTQRYRCKGCRRSFQPSYTYTAWQPGIKDQIITQTLNSSGVRDISRNLGISKDTVTATLKKKTLVRWTPTLRRNSRPIHRHLMLKSSLTPKVMSFGASLGRRNSNAGHGMCSNEAAAPFWPIIMDDERMKAASNSLKNLRHFLLGTFIPTTGKVIRSIFHLISMSSARKIRGRSSERILTFVRILNAYLERQFVSQKTKRSMIMW